MTRFHRPPRRPTPRHVSRILAVAAAVAAFVVATLSPLQATQRMVLVESYTNSG